MDHQPNPEFKSTTPLAGNEAGSRVLVVDDDPVVATTFGRLLSASGYQVEIAGDGLSALAAVDRQAPDVVLLDVKMPQMDGFEVCEALKRDSVTRLTPVILVTGLSHRDHRIRGLNAGADDFLSKPVDSLELLARVGALVRLKRYTDDLDSASSIIMTMTEMIESRDGRQQGHCYRMANRAAALGRRLGLSAADIQSLYRGGFLHDIGMLAISDTVLRKSGTLTPEEYELIKSHTVVGDQLCSKLRSLQAVRPIIRHHHEHEDGSGYPDRLRGEAIPLLAAIVGIVDVFDAITVQRPYQSAQTEEKALSVLWQEVDVGWRRRELVEEFAALVTGGLLDTYTPSGPRDPE